MRQRPVRTQPRTSDEALPTARRVLRDKSHLRRAAIPHRRAAEATRPVRTAGAGTATLAAIADTAHLPTADRPMADRPTADRPMADRTAADAAIRRLRRIAPDHLAAITAAVDRMRVPVAITAARAADTRVRTEAMDAKLDLISILTPPSNLGGDSFCRDIAVFLCIPRFSMRSVYTARFSLRSIP